MDQVNSNKSIPDLDDNLPSIVQHSFDIHSLKDVIINKLLRIRGEGFESI